MLRIFQLLTVLSEHVSAPFRTAPTISNPFALRRTTSVISSQSRWRTLVSGSRGRLGVLLLTAPPELAVCFGVAVLIFRGARPGRSTVWSRGRKRHPNHW